jgi:hypothetical protein
VLQLTSLSGDSAGSLWVARRFPVRIGRAAHCHVRVEEAGLWDEHVEIEFDSQTGFVARRAADGLLVINGQVVDRAVLRHGDVLALGSLQLRFDLSPVRPRDWRLREALTWIALITLCLGQAALVRWLAG